ncbi:hypothetical protein TrST_g11749 [Triparma strigata]|uniref:Endonuclease/exonuclease/phosphatase domain-containing protein n=1 Tax=Triparma strigata TaxID=1606541 RepID=A0A9W7F318_9STRA|nr:hypothetical protein TrST_g11749 [Triparma strigata]
MATPSSSPPPLTPEIIATVFLVHPTITGPGQAPLEFRERSSSYDPTLSSSPASFSLLTYNIAGLSPHINVNPPFRRLQEYCTRLEESSSSKQPDIICFQEAFSPHVSQKIIKKALVSYPYKVVEPLPIPPSLPLIGPTLQMNSGLCIVSKYPIIWADAMSYGSDACGADFQANKGCVGVGIEVNGKEIAVFTSHLQSDPCNDPLWWCVKDAAATARKIKQIQLKKFANFFQTKIDLRKGSKDFAGALVCGDLNVVGEEVTVDRSTSKTMIKQKEHAEYRKMLDKFNSSGEPLVDCFRQQHPLKSGLLTVEEAGLTINGERNLDPNDYEMFRLDYVFMLGSGFKCVGAKVEEYPWTDVYGDSNGNRIKSEDGMGAVEAQELKRAKCFSDHSAVLAKFQFRE